MSYEVRMEVGMWYEIGYDLFEMVWSRVLIFKGGIERSMIFLKLG